MPAFGAVWVAIAGAPALAAEVERVEIASKPERAGTYAIGQRIEVDVIFDEAVDVGGEPTLTLDVGGTSATARLDARASIGTRVRFGYAVVDGDSDTDGVSIPAQSIAGGTVEDRDGEPADVALPGLEDQDGHRVDGVVEPASVAIVSDAGDDNVYSAGEAIELAVTFQEDVRVQGAPLLAILLGPASSLKVPRHAALVRQTARQLRFAYRVQSGDLDPDGISVGENSLEGRPVEDVAGNRMRTLALADVAEHQVDGIEPELSSIRITSDPGSDATYGLGDAIELSVTFSEVVFGGDLDSLGLALEIGGRSRIASLVDGSGTLTFRFRYTVREEDRDDDGISVSPRALQCDSANCVWDLAGNPLARPFAGIPSQPGHRVDGTAPPRTRVDGVAITSDAGTDQTYGLGDVVEVTVEFSGAVHVTGNPVVTLSVGANSRQAAFAEGSGTSRLAFRYVVQDGDLDEDGISIASDALTEGVIEDADGNRADRRFEALGPQPAHRVDGAAPPRTRVDAVAITSDAGADGTYELGDRVEVKVAFSDVVHVTGAPVVTLSIGANSRQAAFASGSGTPELTFHYAVQDGDLDEDGISIAANALTGGVIADVDGNPADRAFAALAPQPAHRVDGVAPEGIGVEALAITSDAGADRTYRVGDVVEVTVEFSDAVHVTGDPVVTLSVGAHSRPAAFAAGSGTRRLAFRYTVRSGDADEDGISIAADAVTGGTIADADGRPADRTSRALAPQDGHRVDALPPTVVAVAITSDAGAARSYGPGDVVEVTVGFSDVVHVTGDPMVRLNVGATARQAAFAWGSGTRELAFRYTVQYGDADEDGISIAADALTGGMIEDGAGNPADRAFEALGPQPAHRVDAVLETTVDAVRITSDPGPGRTYGAGDDVEVTVEFSDVVHVTGDPVVTLSVGAHSRPAAFASGSGTRRLAFRYTVQTGDSDDDGISIAADALTGGAVEDAAGNPVDRSFAAVGAQRAHRVDALPATVEGVAITSDAGEDGSYEPGDVVEATVEFGDVVYVAGEPVLVLSIGANSREAAFAAGSGTRRLAFRYTVQLGDFDEDGISIAVGALTGGAIEDAAGNPVDRSFAALGPQRAHRVDALPTTVEDVAITSDAGEDGSYEPGDVVEATVEFGDVVYVAGEPVLVLSIGANSREAAFAAGSGTRRLAFRYTVQLGDFDEDGISIAVGALTGGAIEDAAGNPVDRSFAALEPQAAHRVDALPTAVDGVAFTSDAGEDGTYGPGDVVEATVEFSDVVYVTGEPVLVLSIGANSREAAFASGSGTRRLAFRYAVQAGDHDQDGISIAADALAGGAIEDAGGNPVDRSFEALGPHSAHRVDARRTTVEGVAVTSDAGPGRTYGYGDDVEVTVEFSDVVYVTGEPVLVLSIGANSREAAFASGSGTRRLAFRYAVQAGDHDQDGISIAADALAGGAIEDAGGNPVDRSFDALEPQSAHRVDALSTTVEGVAITSDAGEDGIYEPGDVVEATVEFADVVYVTGEPVLTLSVGANSREAAFASGSGTRRLAFRYTVQQGDADEDGISIAADALAGGAIEDAAGNPADRSFEALGPQSSHRVAERLELTLAPVTLALGREEAVDLAETLAQAGVGYADGFNAQSDNPAVVEARTTGGVLVLTPVSEGAALVTVTARLAPITLLVPAEVTASAEELAMLESALAAVGRNLLSSAAMTIGSRLELGTADSSAAGRFASSAAAGVRPRSIGKADSWLGGETGPRHAPGFGGMSTQSGVDHMPPRAGYGGRAMSFSSMGLGAPNRASSWAVWGAADGQTFMGEPEHGTYDGSLTSIYLGADVRGDGWVAGGSVSRSTADVSYDATGEATGSGTLEIDMNAFYPYVQWTPTPKATLWSIVGFGTGDATHRRAGQGDSGEPGQLSMRMGLAGLNVGLGEFGGVSLAVRGDAGIAQLETDEGVRAVQGLGAAVQRVRLGMEFSMPLAAGDRGVLTPFLDVGGRWDGGDGETGGGAEIVGGIRYRGPTGGVEVEARSLAAHGAEGVAESAVAATVFLEPGANAGGLRLSLTPRWGAAESRDVFWGSDYALRRIVERSPKAEWALDGRVGYGFVWREDGLFTPYGEFDLGRHGESRARVGFRYERDGRLDGPVRLDLLGERLVRAGHRAEGGVLVRLEARR